MTSQHIKIHIEYVLPVPSELTYDLDTTVKGGLEHQKRWIADRIPNIVEGTLTAWWQSMPRSWNPPQQKLEVVMTEEADYTEVYIPPPSSGVTHPWDQGLWIFPDDHKLAPLERAARAQYDRAKDLDEGYAEGIREGFQLGVKELTSGE